MHDLTKTAHLPVYSSRRSRGHNEGDKPDPGLEWKGVITRYHADGTIEFDDGSVLEPGSVDKIIYCTGYRPSFPFWNVKNNGRPLYDYEKGKLVGNYWHTFFHDLPTSLGIVGIQKSLTFRSFEYQAVALARLFAGRNTLPLPSAAEMRAWEAARTAEVAARGAKFHDVESQPGQVGDDTFVFLGFLYRLAGLGTLRGDGRVPPVLSRDLLWALKNIKKYPTTSEGGDLYLDGTAVVENNGTPESGAGWKVNRDGDEEGRGYEWVVASRN